MIREDRFVQSHQPYAVHLDSFIPRGPGGQASINAVWFRRRRGGWGSEGDIATVACAGYIPECQIVPPPADAADFLARMTDGRYGGHCLARWDGRSLWAPETTPAAYKAYLELLGPMLANHPAVPEGYQGWWTFRGC
jgi:hypothetical protein